YRAGDPLCDLVLDGKRVGQFAIVAVRPEMVPGFGINQLRGDPDPVAGAADATLYHVAHTELARHLGDVDGRTLVGERRAAGDHKESAVARQVGNDVLGNTLREIFLFGIAAHVGEGQHRDRRLPRCRARGRFTSGGFTDRLRAEENAVDA